MKTVFLNRFLQILFISSFIITFSCSKDEDGPENPPISQEDATEFNAAMAQLGEFTQPTEEPQQEVGDPELERDQENQTLECATQLYKLSPGFDEMLTLDPSTDVIYPGAMLKGETIPTGEYVGINLDRTPITLSASLTNISGSPVVTIENPTLSTVREGIKQILDQEVTGATAAKINYEITQVYNEKHIDVAIGVNYRGAGKKVSANVDFSSSQYKNTFVLKFLQQYYTIDMDPPGRNPSDLFTNLPNVDALGSTSPVYVASVAYGRMVIYTIETNSSLTEVNAAFDASVGSTDGSIDASYAETINSSKIQALIIGGSGSGAAQTINGPADVFKFISEGGNYSKESPGAPLSYKLRYIRKDFPIARQVLTTEYPIRTCYEAYQKYRIELGGIEMIDHAGENGDLSLHGYLNIKLFQGGVLKASESYTRTRNNYISVREGVFWPIPGDETSEVELYKPSLENDYVIIEAEFTEDDVFSSNEYLGKSSRKIFLKDIKSEFDDAGDLVPQPEILELTEDSGSDFDVTFYVSRRY
ncbi:thiol-activated cytolysin family protein [Spongiivirga citrea]|uniref:Thiol-activated cytolysin n=1 Tax=Spongiivirga citrea TaxID=1481457 RepID=A0A6M0CCT8_9FLAO|nr:thiol-activated cytolysin family protein [Spongiivirga citrea]NER15638.1 hypothetical protein [Spongiivirga citrea]